METPIIKLQIEEMKHTLITHFNQYQERLSEQVNGMIESAIENYDFEAEVTKAVHDNLNELIKQTFSYGKGKEVMRKVVEESMNDFLNLSKGDG